MGSQGLILTPEQQPRPLSVVGMQITVLAANATTGSYGLTLQEGDEGTGPPPHRHGWDEAFYVLSGNIEFKCSGQTVACRQGTLVHVPRGTEHAFTFGSGGGRMLEITGPGADAAPFFTAIDREIPAGVMDLGKLLELAGRHGVEFSA